MALKTEALGTQREDLDGILKAYNNLEPKIDLLNDLGIALQVCLSIYPVISLLEIGKPRYEDSKLLAGEETNHLKIDFSLSQLSLIFLSLFLCLVLFLVARQRWRQESARAGLGAAAGFRLEAAARAGEEAASSNAREIRSNRLHPRKGR